MKTKVSYVDAFGEKYVHFEIIGNAIEYKPIEKDLFYCTSVTLSS